MSAIVRGYNKESVQAAYLLYVQAMTEFTTAVQTLNFPVAQFWGGVARLAQRDLDNMLYREFVSELSVRHLSYFEFTA